MSIEDLKLQQVFRAISSVKELPEENWEEIKTHFKFRSLKRKEHFLRAGEVAKEVAFINLGMMRMYYVTKNGHEANRSFASENSFFGDHASLLLGEPSRFSIQAMEPCEILAFEQKRLVENEDWRQIQLLFIERTFLIKEKREAQFLIDPPEVRYQSFLSDHPGLSSRLSDHHIASYLGISSVHLSRIKKKLKIKK